MLLYRPDINRGWRVVYDGYGKVGVEETEKGEQVHYLSPMRPKRPEETHAALKIDTKTYRDLQLTCGSARSGNSGNERHLIPGKQPG